MCKRKEHQESLSEKRKKTKGTLDLIHSDVCGHIASTYLSGYEYYVTFIDDY